MSLVVAGLAALSHGAAAAGEERRVELSSRSPDMMSRIYGDIRLMSARDQEIFIYNGILKKRRVFARLPFRYRPQINWHGSDIAEIMVATGSPGRFSIFYDLREDVFSEQMWFVLAFEKTRRIAVLGEDRLRVVKVSENREILEIKRNDFQRTAILFLIVERAEFDSQGDLTIHYRNRAGGSSIAVIESSEMGD